MHPEPGKRRGRSRGLFGSEVHMYPHLRRVGGQFVQRCSHPGVVRPPEDSMPSPGFFVLSVPCVGEEVLTIHSWYLRVVAVGAQPPEPPQYGPRQHSAGNARLLAAPNRCLAAGSTARSCLLKSADGGTPFGKDGPDQVADARAAVCDRALACASLLSPERTFDLSGTSNFDPSLHGRWSRVLSGLECSQIRLLITDLREEDGAFMEPSGRNQWQPVANVRA